ncbi:P8 family protein [Pediococcus claussenii]|uniref:Uncharacterized protein n=1 Tax=Pediococcus claussenii (strain ATCC BAA-344 / DSM 14800 / JCM 18046 / KCTC 3811 / LMG 21948 / P06) TaxID=701521 RepID=G8PBL0_PEDCP|nr:hypothetical protein [Pediococcus claussenii]AEV94759.1 hypothetical protein PECL_456 [Pediococcus claussenii ATCC BAA-344]ANZ69955.1 hypothetical protein AYR57_06350 [Pediococcus claussenii]ANZ71771.1 hypothetical protein AYR58_06350 [Pediococcus claussenii]KRN20938.1 hypothetical protein IV79_GL000163 [Pediococcus claussenii]
MANVLKLELLDKAVNEVFDWSDDSTPLRDAMWNHTMDANGRDTLKTTAEAKKWEGMSADELKTTAEAMLKS